MEDYFTSLSGRRLKKSAPIFKVLGDLDELNAVLGVARSFTAARSLNNQILKLQDDLIDIGGLLAGETKGEFLKEKTAYLKAKIGKLKNSSIKNFSRPGVNKTSAFLHLARAVCRRLERGVVGLGDEKYQSLAAYFNHLSSLLFWLAKKEEKIL